MEKLIEFLSTIKLDTPLYFLIALAVGILLFLFPIWKKKRLSVDMGYWEKKLTFKSNRLLIFFVPVMLVLVLLSFSIAGLKQTQTETVDIYGIPVMLVVDISASMEGSTSRTLEAYYNLLDNRGNINFGLTVFASKSYVVRYFVNKDELLSDMLEDETYIRRISGGTYIAQALEAADEYLNENSDEDSDKAIILISDLNTDSQSEWDNILTAMESITERGTKIYMVFSGWDDQFTLEGQSLENITNISGVEIIDLDDEAGITQICENISENSLTLIRTEETSEDEDINQLAVYPAIGAILVCLILSETWFRKIP